MKNNTFQEISAVLLAAKKLLLYPHIHMDGDALGSCAALCKALRACIQKLPPVSNETKHRT